MPLLVPNRQDFHWLYSNVATTRLVAAWGTAHTPAVVPSFSTYATLVSAANITTDVYGVELIFSGYNTAGQIRQLMVNIGVDTAGGTSFTTRIPNLIAGHCGSMIVQGGINYYFPLYIPSGSSIGIQATGTVNSVSVSAAIKLYGRPTRPDAINAGSYITAFGADSTTAQGTAITLGTTAEGAYTQVGSTTTKPYWWWQMGFTFNDSGIAAASCSFDIAAGSSTTVNKQLVSDILYFVNGNEQYANIPPTHFGSYGEVGIGENIYIRGQYSGTVETSPTVAAYGLGG